MTGRDILAKSLNSVGVFLSVSAIWLGVMLFRRSDAGSDVNVSDIELGAVMQRQS